MTRGRPLKPDLDRLLMLLEQERRALRRADMPGLVRLAPRKEAILARIEAQGAGQARHHAQDEPIIHTVRQNAARNARLFEAALRGLAEAHALIDRCSRQPGDQTYARNGARRLVDPPHGNLERRA